MLMFPLTYCYLISKSKEIIFIFEYSKYSKKLSVHYYVFSIQKVLDRECDA